MAATVIRPQAGPQEKFLQNPSDIVIYGGAAGGGKSYALLLEPLRHVKNPHFGGVIFRRTSPQITNEGGLWDQSEKLYTHIGATPVKGNSLWRFPSGATLTFRHLQHNKDKLAWQGSEIPFIGFDELTHFEESQFWYMLSRNRSLCGVRPYIRATCNPDADSWVAKLLEWWIDQDSGFAIAERAGQIRWFVRVSDQFEWANSPEELLSRHPGIPPKSLAFVPAKLTDNQELLRADPGYLANLLALPLVERERLLGGNWKIRPSSGLIFNRAWFEIVPATPAIARRVRYWDKASIAGGGDWSCGVKMVATDDGQYFVENVVRGQWSSLQRNAVIRQTAVLDGVDVAVWLEQEPGSGGKESAELSIRQLAGFNVHAETVSGDKESRARGLSAQAEAGNVKLLAGEWNEAFLNELHAFPLGVNDDQVDGATGSFNKLALGAGIWSFGASKPEKQGTSLTSPPAGVFHENDNSTTPWDSSW